MSEVKNEREQGAAGAVRPKSHSENSHNDGGSHGRPSPDDDDDVESARSFHEGNDDLERYSTHHSMAPDAPMDTSNSVVEIPDEVYDRIKPSRKVIIVCLLSFLSFLAPISSTSVLSATPEVAAEYGTTGSIVNLANALYSKFDPHYGCPFRASGRNDLSGSKRQHDGACYRTSPFSDAQLFLCLRFPNPNNLQCSSWA
jgi:hypothetical protein